jgi:plasmid maintenance system antidote protein VapI
MSDTLRTDEQTYDIEITRGDALQEAIFYPCGIGDHVSAVFTRQLERELAAAKALAESNGKLAHDTAIRLACISTQRDEMLEALQSCFDVFVNQGWDDDLIAAKNAKAAIAKAKSEPS